MCVHVARSLYFRVQKLYKNEQIIFFKKTRRRALFPLLQKKFLILIHLIFKKDINRNLKLTFYISVKRKIKYGSLSHLVLCLKYGYMCWLVSAIGTTGTDGTEPAVLIN